MASVWTLFGLFLACSSPVGPDWIRVEPPPSFRAIHAQVEACTGAQYPFEAFEWYVVPDLGAGVGGRWDAPHWILLSPKMWATQDRLLVTHELIHAVTQGAWSHAAGWTAYVPSAAAWEGCGGR